MNNTIDLTEKRVFKDKVKEEITKLIPWKKSKNDGDNSIYRQSNSTYTTTSPNRFNGNMYITFNTGRSSFNLSTQNLYFDIDDWVDTHTSFDLYYDDFEGTSTIQRRIRLDVDNNPTDIFGKKKKRDSESYFKPRIPWNSKAKETIKKEIPWKERNRRSLKRRSLEAEWYLPEIPFVGYELGQEENLHFNKPEKSKIPWKNYVKGEKNPINSWNLPEDFEDKDIEMSNDSWFLRPESQQRHWQLGIN